MSKRGAAGGTVSNWAFSGCDFASNPASGSSTAPAISTDQYTANMQFTGCFVTTSNYGVLLGSGTFSASANQIIITGSQFVGNFPADVAFNGAVNCNVAGNSLISATTNSAVELGGVYSAGSQGKNYIVGNYAAAAFSVTGNCAQRQSNWPSA